MTPDLVDRIATARWHVAFRTFGNNHASLIGLLVDWWITESPEDHWALEGAPAHDKGGICDAILGEGHLAQSQPRGVVEVEGTDHEGRIKQIGNYFASTRADLVGIKFGIFLGYTYKSSMREMSKGFFPPLQSCIALAQEVTRTYPDNEIAILGIEKLWESTISLSRKRNEYYRGRPTALVGALVRNGNVVRQPEILFRA